MHKVNKLLILLINFIEWLLAIDLVTKMASKAGHVLDCCSYLRGILLKRLFKSLMNGLLGAAGM
ncbi:hypothetical protein D3C86_1977670 [compost metagenome]